MVRAGCQTHFHQGHISLAVAFKGPNVISTPSQLRSSYIYTALKLFRPFEGNCEDDVASGENEFDTPGLYPLTKQQKQFFVCLFYRSSFYIFTTGICVLKFRSPLTKFLMKATSLVLLNVPLVGFMASFIYSNKQHYRHLCALLMHPTPLLSTHLSVTAFDPDKKPAR